MWNTTENTPRVQSAQEQSPVCQTELGEAKFKQDGQRQPEALFHEEAQAVPSLEEQDDSHTHGGKETPVSQTCGSFLSAAFMYISAAVKGSL